jgi:L-alanine-DL-glutamate epimerase-like enolase superfamily enzyme
MKMTVSPITRPLGAPFAITGYTFTHLEAIWVTLEAGGVTGRGEGVGIYYQGETPDTMAHQLEGVRGAVEEGATREEIQELLPLGGARNALDCAYWDWECKQAGVTIWQKLDLRPQPLLTVATVGMGTPAEMAATAQAFGHYPHLKIKLSGDDPIGKLQAVRNARPDATLVIDVNQGWTLAELESFLPQLSNLEVAMIEQPLPRGADSELVGFSSPIPLGGDESCLGLAEYDEAATKYDVINIKLDKCGGLTEALQMVSLAQADGKDLMVGNMTGTSLSMAPSHVVGQFCRFVDIDGPLLLASDISPGLHYGDNGMVSPPEPELWG